MYIYPGYLEFHQNIYVFISGFSFTSIDESLELGTFGFQAQVGNEY